MVWVSLDAGNDLDLLVDEMADVSVVIDIEFHQEIVIARGGIDLRGDLGFGERVGDGVGLAELALELNEKGNHRCCLRKASRRTNITFSGDVNTASQRENH